MPERQARSDRLNSPTDETIRHGSGARVVQRRAGRSYPCMHFSIGELIGNRSEGSQSGTVIGRLSVPKKRSTIGLYVPGAGLEPAQTFRSEGF